MTERVDGPWWAIALNFLPFVLMIGLGYMLYTRMQAQGQSIFSIGKSRAQLYDRRKERTTFDGVAGTQGAKTELQEIIEFLRNPTSFQRLGGEMPKGVLLVEPPGTGKTLLARAVAGEADVPFFCITGSDFMGMLVGVGASRVRDLFGEAKKASPASFSLRREYSEMTAREVDEEIKAILEESYERAVGTLQEHRSELDRVADALLESEEIPGESSRADRGGRRGITKPVR